jgi:hypothetical protein
MKRIIASLAVLGVALAALRFTGPAVAARARQKCAEMLEGRSSPCSPQQRAACGGAS